MKSILQLLLLLIVQVTCQMIGLPFPKLLLNFRLDTYYQQCNGQGIILQFTLGSIGSVSAAIANQTLDLHQYGIPYNIAYTHTSIPALFRSFKVIQPCLRYTHDKIQSGQMPFNSKTSREMITFEGKSYFALRSKVCTRGITLSSTSCLKCKVCFTSPKRKLE